MCVTDALPVLERLIPHLAAVYLFGSEARGDARADSDIDLGIVTGAALAAVDLDAARQAVELVLNRDIDLVDLGRASPILVRQVLLEGHRLAAPDAMVADLFEIRMMREYEDLKYRRAGIEADILARGRVFAS